MKVLEVVGDQAGGDRADRPRRHCFDPRIDRTGPARRNRDARLARPLLELLNQDSAPYVGDRLPYAVQDESDYSLPVHGERRGLPHVGIRSART